MKGCDDITTVTVSINVTAFIIQYRDKHIYKHSNCLICHRNNKQTVYLPYCWKISTKYDKEFDNHLKDSKYSACNRLHS